MSYYFYKIVIFVKYIKYIRQSSIYKSQITRHQFSSRGKKFWERGVHFAENIKNDTYNGGLN
jgi:hypothetical protein